MPISAYFVRFLAISASASAISSDEASLIAWKAYGDLIGKYMTANVPLTPGQDFIYVVPPTSNFVRGGTPCPESVTNFELYNVVNPLQNSTSPLLGTDGPSYHQSLETYLESVAIGDKELTPEQEKKRAALEALVDTARVKFTKKKSASFLAWRNDEVAKYYNQSFQSWVVDNDPNYANYEKDLTTADANYNNYMLSILGSKYNLIQEQRRNINGKAQNELAPVPGYNMPIYPAADNFAVQISNPLVKSEITDFIAYRPSYSLAAYEQICDNYFLNKAGSASLSYNFKNVDGHDWSSLGYQQKIVKGSGGFFGIFGVKASKESEVTHYDSWSNTFSQEVKITLTMKGAPQVVNINAGSWDVGNVRNVYPTLRANETDDLKGHVRLTKALVGYGLGMKIEFTNVNTWKNVTQFIEKGKKNLGGGIQLFGFSFGAGGGGAYQYTYDDLKTSSTTDGGAITIPSTPDGQIFMLGALGKAL